MKLRITSRMRAGFAAMSVLLLLGGLVTVLYTYHVQSVTTSMLAQNASGMQSSEALELAVERLTTLATEDVLAGGPRGLRLLDERKAEFLKLVQDTRRSTGETPPSAVLDKLAESFAVYERELRKVLESAPRALPAPGLPAAAAAPQANLAAVTDAAHDLHELFEQFEIANEDLVYADLRQINVSNRIVRYAMYGLGAAGILLGYLLGLVISRSITNPIYELVLKVRGATGYELVERVDVPGGAELEDLDEHLRQLIDRVNTTRSDLERSNRLLQRSEKLAALGRVSAAVAHEIRNPLTSIKMLIYSMSEDAAFDADRKKDLAVIAREIDRTDRFVEVFLQFARPPHPKFEPVDLNQVAHETMELLAPRLRQAHVHLEEAYHEGLGRVRADADQIRQVLMNLALNAIDAMPEGGTLAIETRPAPAVNGDGAAGVQLRVKDTGRGIPAELLDKLFEPFVSGREDGIGLGLAISHQIMQQHGGWIDAVSDSGGTTVIVSLPGEAVESHA